MRTAALLTLAAALALTACDRKQPEAPPPANDLVEVPVETEAANAETPPENIANNAALAVPPPQFTDDAQMLDDADATGLTARLPEGEGVAPGASANQTQPAE